MNNKRINTFTLLLLALVVLLFSGCSSSSDLGDKFIMGGTFRLDENESIDGNLSIFGGAVSLDKGSTVNGNIVLIGGTVSVEGTVNGGINGLGGSITLGDTAVVKGDVAAFGATVNKSETAVVQGKVVSQSENGVQLPDVPQVVVPAVVKPIADAMGSLVRSLVIAILAVLVTLFLPRQTINVSKAIEENPVSSGAIGLLTVIVLPFVIIILAITILLIPLSLIAALIFGLGLIFGWIAVGYELGERLSGMFKSVWAPAVSAGVGTFVLSIISALVGAIPCVGWVVPTIIVFIATGGVIISAFGTRGISKPPSGPSIHIETPNVPPTPSVPPAPVVDQPPSSTSSVDVSVQSASPSFTTRRSSLVVDSTFIQNDEEKPARSVLKTITEEVQTDAEVKEKKRARKPKEDSGTNDSQPTDVK